MSCHVMSCHVLDIQYSEWIFFRMDRSVRFSTLRNMCDYSPKLSVCRSARFFLLKPCDLDSTLYMFPIHFSHTCIKYPYNQQNMPSSFLFVFFVAIMYKKHLIFSLKSYHDCFLQAIFSVFHDQKSVPSMCYYHSNSSKKSKTLFYIFRLNLKCSCHKTISPHDIHSIVAYSSIPLMHT